jgi:hypothetical protein
MENEMGGTCSSQAWKGQDKLFQFEKLKGTARDSWM